MAKGRSRPPLVRPSSEHKHNDDIRHSIQARAAWLHRVKVAILAAALSAGPIAPLWAGAASPAGAPTEASVTAWAMQWFKEMQAGRTDHSQYTPAYRAQVTDTAIKAMSRALNQYGASPLRAEIVQTRKIDNQTFYIVKFVFPRGDATTLLFGFDAAGKITGVGVAGLAGD
jgi:hypothetical protein